MISRTFFKFHKNLCFVSANAFAGQSKFKVVFLRHGESTWNKENRFTGWTDVTLSPKGVEEARAAGRDLKKSNF